MVKKCDHVTSDKPDLVHLFPAPAVYIREQVGNNPSVMHS